MTPTLALLPLDDRPVSLLFPQRIAQIAGLELIMPPRSILGHFKNPGIQTDAGVWLKKTAKDGIEGLLVAAEMLAYGGLYASRYPNLSLEQALENIMVLEHIHNAHPQLPIFVVSLVMRHTISASGAKAVPVYEALMRFTELEDLVSNLGKTEYLPELEAVRGRIPEEDLRHYLEARRRNHAVNLKLLEYRSNGTIQELIFLQDDSRPNGLHRREQEDLLLQAGQKGLTGKINISPGGDEGALDLLSLWINRRQSPKFELRYTSMEGSGQVADYEDRPIIQTVESHLQAAGVTTVEQGGDLIFWVHSPSFIPEVDRAAAEIRGLIQSGRPVALADVRFPNGSDPSLLERLCASGLLPRLAAYAGWNTAGNSLGAAIAQASAWLYAVRHAPGDEQRRAQMVYLWERVVDDWGYQRVMRQPLEESLKVRGKDILDLGLEAPAVEIEIRARLIQWAGQTWRSGQWKGNPPSLSVSLPWGRTFEVEVTAGTDP